jgi:hypothetical protein
MRIKGSELRKIIKEEISRSLLRETPEEIEIPEEPPAKLQKITPEEAKSIALAGPDAFEELLDSIPNEISRAKTKEQIRKSVMDSEISNVLVKAVSDYILMGPDEPLGSEDGMTARQTWLRALERYRRNR